MAKTRMCLERRKSPFSNAKIIIPYSCTIYIPFATLAYTDLWRLYKFIDEYRESKSYEILP